MTTPGCGPAHDSSTSSQDYGYLDQDDFRRHYADADNPRRMTFYVENVHCTSCLWRIESLQREMADIADIRLDMGRHILDIEVSPGGGHSPPEQRPE